MIVNPCQRVRTYTAYIFNIQRVNRIPDKGTIYIYIYKCKYTRGIYINKKGKKSSKK